MKKVATTTTGPACLMMRWVPVTRDGRTRLEMRWSAPATVLRVPRTA
ncbi:hypothetical protein LL946_14675 [Knoellia locipacati]